MSSIGILNWRDERGYQDYPLSRSVNDIKNFIVDANFMQFDGFIPKLKSIQLNVTSIDITLTCDLEDIEFNVLSTDTIKRIYDSDGRYVGMMTFGVGIAALLKRYSNTLLTLNIPFLAQCVVSVDSNRGVYSIDGAFGNVAITTGTTQIDRSIHFSVVGNDVTWDAVALPPFSVVPLLRTINGKHPIGNNVFILDSELVKVVPGSGAITVSLATSTENTSVVPTIKYQ